MGSCADELEEATRRSALALTAEARILRALELGRCDLELYAAASGLTVEQASLALRTRRAEARRAAQQRREP